ncbi:MAG TPA: restriction endonuclease subunit R [Thermoplasmatales archaeon]|nr:restriction endonuclease subunit R [Thermoplasmatales archaeon]
MSDSDIHKKLEETLRECSILRQENERLKKLLNLPHDNPLTQETSLDHECPVSTVTNDSPAEMKIALFRRLFKGRKDIYPLRWETKHGKAGYSPACRFEWNRAYCDKPRTKCGQCDNRDFLPVTDKVIYDHLAGIHTMGVYPLLPDDTCWFLAADFDKSTWQEDVAEYLETCKKFRVPAILERSRSGKGGHVWIFFSEPVAASVARKVGCYILTKTMERRHQIGLDSYDRLFPNQDTLPKGGFGNLIALPLQKEPRKEGNSVFLDENFRPYPDQWAFLSKVNFITKSELEAIAQEATRKGEVVGVKISQTSEEEDEDPWTLPPSGRKNEPVIEGPLPPRVNGVLADLLYIDKKDLPPTLHNRLIRLAAFQNPEFYKYQAMRLPTYDKPRVISCSEDFSKHIGFPRGCLTDVTELLTNLDIKLKIQDERTTGKPLRVSFKGHLRSLQVPAVKALREHDIGILSAATAFGKTVVAAKMISIRKRNTLVLVHRRQLLDQWRERLATFLNISENDIGQIGGGKKKPSGRLDIGILQSFYRKGEVNDIVADYGHIIVDECHHLSAFSFEQIMKKAKAKYVLGLTATPLRKDGHHPIILMQCGPIRFRVAAKSAADNRPFDHIMIPRYLGTKYSPAIKESPSIQEIYRSLATDDTRNMLIVDDVLQTVSEGRSPLILTERTDHLERLAELLHGKVKNIVILRGGMGKKQRIEVSKKLDDIGDNMERVLLATGRYIGEGFDDARLDTLLLALPISWKGTLQQYAGRLHRNFEGKKEVRIYDYVDASIPMLLRMYDKRIKGYKDIGYAIQEEQRQLSLV